METRLIKERYKVIRVLYAEEDYAALQAVDIQSREKRGYLLNVYEGEYLKPYLNSFMALRGCEAYRDIFLWEGSLVSVFEYREGTDIDRVFYRGVKIPWQERLRAARTLIQQALVLSTYPAQISCAAMLSENIQVLREEPSLVFNYMVRPLEEMNERELVLLLTDQVQKVLLPRWDAPEEERRFVRRLCGGGLTTVAEVYGYWTATVVEIEAAYERIEGKGALGRGLYLVFMNVRDWAREHITGGRKRGKGV